MADASASESPNGGRTWWVHFAFTRINIGPTILRKKIEDAREPGAALINVAAVTRDLNTRVELGARSS